jgi:drug/metabolite transporter, DME family
VTEDILLVSAVAFATSIVFAFSNHTQHIALDHMDVRTGTLVNITVTFLFLLICSPLYLKPESLLNPSILWFALAGLIVPSLSMTLHTMSVRMIGPGLTAGLTSTAPVFATGLAVVLLGEVVTGQTLAGTAIIVGGIGFIALRSRRAGVSWPIWAVVIPLGAALVRAIAHNVVKIGLTDLPNPMTAALVGSVVSMAVMISIHESSSHKLPRWNSGYLWFGLCGVLNGIGLVGLNIALVLGDVVIVAPLIATVPAFTLLIGWLIFRRESLHLASIMATAIIFCGCMLVILQ